MELCYSFKKGVHSLEISSGGIKISTSGEEIFTLSPRSAADKLIPVSGSEPGTYDVTEDIDTDELKFYSDGEWYIWETASTAWDKKQYMIKTDGLRFTYKIRLFGQGRVGEIRYFGGKKTGCGEYGSRYGFFRYYVPCHNSSEMRPGYALSNFTYRSYFELMCPPMCCFAFQHEAVPDWCGLALGAEPGGYNFLHYDYRSYDLNPMSSFALATDMEGHSEVDGIWDSPVIFPAYGGDEFDVMRDYVSYSIEAGYAPPPPEVKAPGDIPRWWYGPIICGWGEQEALCKPDCSQAGMATQSFYTDFVNNVTGKGLSPTIVIIDDKWQDGYGSSMPDPTRWPDLRAFTDEMHRQNIHTLMWFRLWGGEGLEDDEVMPGDGMPYNYTVRLNYPPYADPTNPRYVKRLRSIIYKLLSSDEGCFNADGFKLDYSLVMPYGRRAVSYGAQYGIELTKTLLKLIYDTAKEVKPDALINCSPCHPYFSDVVDMARLHDLSRLTRSFTTKMSERMRLYRIALGENILIDCDSANYTNHDDCMRYLMNQPKIGIPDIYQVSDNSEMHLSDGDWDMIRKVWQDYSAGIAALYGEEK